MLGLVMAGQVTNEVMIAVQVTCFECPIIWQGSGDAVSRTQLVPVPALAHYPVSCSLSHGQAQS